MAVDFGYRVYVTKGELATIMGPLEYGAAKLKLRNGAMGDTGRAIVELLDEQTGIDLDNPEVVTLFDQLLAAGVITQTGRNKVAAFVAAQLGTAPNAPVEPRHRWRLPAGVDPSDWFVSVSIEIEPSTDGYVRVWTTATVCNHPDAVMEV